MKKLFTLTALFAAPVFANPYLGVEYGMSSTDHDFESTVNGKQLNPESDDGVLGAFVGYKFDDNWGLELGYRQFELSDSYSVETRDETFEYEQDWDADIDAKQITLMPMYFYSLNEKWTMKAGAGISYTQYDYSSSYSAEKEEILTDIDTDIDHKNGDSGTAKEWGGVVSLGIEYAIMTNLTLGASAKYQVDSYANSTSFNISSAYYF